MGRKIFTDDQMAAAMIDCLIHHGHPLLFEGKQLPYGACADEADGTPAWGGRCQGTDRLTKRPGSPDKAGTENPQPRKAVPFSARRWAGLGGTQMRRNHATFRN